MTGSSSEAGGTHSKNTSSPFTKKLCLYDLISMFTHAHVCVRVCQNEKRVPDVCLFVYVCLTNRDGRNPSEKKGTDMFTFQFTSLQVTVAGVGAIVRVSTVGKTAVIAIIVICLKPAGLQLLIVAALLLIASGAVVVCLDTIARS